VLDDSFRVHPAASFFRVARRDTIAFRDTRSLRVRRSFATRATVTGSLAFSGDGRMLAVGSDHAARVLDVATGVELMSVPVDDYYPAVNLSPDGTRLAVTTQGMVQVWEVPPRPFLLLKAHLLRPSSSREPPGTAEGVERMTRRVASIIRLLRKTGAEK
jgi:WD40 repeat protein